MAGVLDEQWRSLIDDQHLVSANESQDNIVRDEIQLQSSVMLVRITWNIVDHCFIIHDFKNCHY